MNASPAGLPILAPNAERLPYTVRIGGGRLAFRICLYAFISLMGLALLAVAAGSTGVGPGPARASSIGVAVLIASVGLSLAGIGLRQLWMLRAPAAVFHADRLEIPTLSGRRVLRRAEIAGVSRTIATRNGSYFQIYPVAGAGPVARLDGWVREDPVVAGWFDGAPDPVAEAVKTDRASVLADPRYGADENERAARLGLAKTIVSGFSVACLGLAGWLGFFAPLNLVSIAVGAGAIAAGAVLVQWSDGLVVWIAQRKARPSVIAALAPLAALAARSVFITHLVDLLPIVCVALALGLAVTAAVGVKWSAESGGLNGALSIGVGAGMLGFGLFILADVALDPSLPAVARATVMDKHVSHGKSTRYVLTLGPWGRTAGGDANVSGEFYDQVPVGLVICVSHHPGALGVIWYELGTCPGSSSGAASSTSRYYPVAAELKQTEGSAVVSCAVANDLKLRDCRAVSETPPGYGFGDAAVKDLQDQVVLKSRPPSGQIRTTVRFKLDENPTPPRAGLRR